jgi:hypothetical protein
MIFTSLKQTNRIAANPEGASLLEAPFLILPTFSNAVLVGLQTYCKHNHQ